MAGDLVALRERSHQVQESLLSIRAEPKAHYHAWTSQQRLSASSIASQRQEARGLKRTNELLVTSALDRRSSTSLKTTTPAWQDPCFYPELKLASCGETPTTREVR